MSNHSPRRIVSLQPSATVILAATGELDRIVACTKYCVDLCPEVMARQPLIVADSWTAQAGQILAARPDLVIASVPYQEKAVIEILKSGIPFLGFAPRTLANIYTDIASIAGIVGVSDRGEQVIAAMQNEIASVRQQTRGLEHPRVYCEEWGKPLIHSQPWVAELVAAAGGEFIGTPGAKTTAEATLSSNPDVIIAAWCGVRDRVPLRKIIRDRGWEQIPAACSGRIYCIRDEFLNTPAPSLIQGLHALAACIHPEIFPLSAGVRGIAGE
jgi:iron complex transport system substrate-binding protein